MKRSYKNLIEENEALKKEIEKLRKLLPEPRIVYSGRFEGKVLFGISVFAAFLCIYLSETTNEALGFGAAGLYALICLFYEMEKN